MRLYAHHNIITMFIKIIFIIIKIIHQVSMTSSFYHNSNDICFPMQACHEYWRNMNTYVNFSWLNERWKYRIFEHVIGYLSELIWSSFFSITNVTRLFIVKNYKNIKLFYLHLNEIHARYVRPFRMKDVYSLHMRNGQNFFSMFQSFWDTG